jgi:hypothetical protein
MPSNALVALKSVNDISEAYEWMFNAQRDGQIDAKTADALNTTLKGATYLRVKLRMDAAKLLIQAQIKKVQIPEKLLPEL